MHGTTVKIKEQYILTKWQQIPAKLDGIAIRNTIIIIQRYNYYVLPTNYVE